MRSALTTWFSFQGRIGRARWIGQTALLAVVFGLAYWMLDRAVGSAATWILYPPLLWSAASIAVRRLHDRAHSAGVLLWLALPIVGPLWMLVQLAILPGTRGENQYGADPLDAGLDYFVVQ